MPSFVKCGGSRNSHEMRLSGMPGMGLLISPSFQTFNENIEFKTLKTNDENRNHLLRYDVHILEVSFHDV